MTHPISVDICESESWSDAVIRIYFRWGSVEDGDSIDFACEHLDFDWLLDNGVPWSERILRASDEKSGFRSNYLNYKQIAKMRTWLLEPTNAKVVDEAWSKASLRKLKKVVKKAKLDLKRCKAVYNSIEPVEA